MLRERRLKETQQDDADQFREVSPDHAARGTHQEVLPRPDHLAQIDGRTGLPQDAPRDARTGELGEFRDHRGGDLALLMGI